MMLRYLNFVLFLLLMWGCQDKHITPEVLKPLAGTWRLAAYEQTLNGKTKWVEVPAAVGTAAGASTLSFRFDGVVLDSKGLPACCGPSALRINGTTFAIEPKAALPDNPQCHLIDCIGCGVLHIEVAGNEFISSCQSGNIGKSRYVRI
ncbi:hypothetical protein [Telluribacter sp.]|uniref:hypothetical protein n=1 Tax=Telluribacter sp. TaxID=1978767 RepID=UPI002E12084A|nr:hypothetical protein [Telluribacter sp.]